MQIFELTKSFPKEERLAMVDQVRHSSRFMDAHLVEAWWQLRSLLSSHCLKGHRQS